MQRLLNAVPDKTINREEKGTNQPRPSSNQHLEFNKYGVCFLRGKNLILKYC
jgi:hypothetical protein